MDDVLARGHRAGQAGLGPQAAGRRTAGLGGGAPEHKPQG